jgi:hypothetical protein
MIRLISLVSKPFILSVNSARGLAIKHFQKDKEIRGPPLTLDKGHRTFVSLNRNYEPFE